MPPTTWSHHHSDQPFRFFSRSHLSRSLSPHNTTFGPCPLAVSAVLKKGGGVVSAPMTSPSRRTCAVHASPKPPCTAECIYCRSGSPNHSSLGHPIRRPPTCPTLGLPLPSPPPPSLLDYTHLVAPRLHTILHGCTHCTGAACPQLTAPAAAPPPGLSRVGHISMSECPTNVRPR